LCVAFFFIFKIDMSRIFPQKKKEKKRHEPSLIRANVHPLQAP